MLVTYIENKHQLQRAKEYGLREVILGHKDFSRFGSLNDQELFELSNFANDLNLKVSFEWDVLMVEHVFTDKIKRFNALDLSFVDTIRVQDQGALEYILNNSDKSLQLIAESANHNLRSLQAYENYIGDRLDRIVLSIELTQDKINEYRSELKTPVEFLILGRILLFYTPRNLLSPLRSKKLKSNETLIGSGESEESPHKGFPLIENQHGTFMFHIKHQFLLDQISSLGSIDYLRVDLRFDSDFDFLKSVLQVINNEVDAKEFKELYPFDTIRGFFKVNKSDVLFKKLKNQKVQRNDLNYLGEVIDAKKPSHLILHLKGKSELKTPSTLKFINPEGKELSFDVNELKSLSGKVKRSAMPGEYVQIQYNSKLWVKSQAYI